MSTRARILAVAAAVTLSAVAAPSAEAVVNGDPVDDGRDFMAALLADGSQICGGSVIAPKRVMTAAHCVADGSADGLSVSVGATDYRDGTVIDVASVAVHPAYEDESSADVAVLHLASAVPASVTPITLAGPADDGLEKPGSKAVVAGWGSQTPIIGLLPPLDTDLYEVELTIVADNDSSCGTSSPANQVCAADFLEDSCQGDSGGPLFADSLDGEVQIGIVSSGVGCGVPGFAGYYTEVNGPSIAKFITSQLG